jgi:hypothetical protein
LAECVLSFTQERLPHTLQGDGPSAFQLQNIPETDFIQHPRKGTNENALFCFRAMAAEKGIFHGKIVV